MKTNTQQLSLFPDHQDRVTETMKRAFKDKKDGAEIKRLYNGVCIGYESQTEADLALCCHLAYWLGDDKTLINQVFRNSALYRSRWDEKQGDQTYGQIMIAKGIADRFHPPVPLHPYEIAARRQEQRR